jgi:hypothetical protein
MLTLRSGDKGEHVAFAQRVLQAGGFYTWKVDGDYGSRTKRAVSAFQRSEKLDSTGVIDPATFEDLLELAMELLRHARREHAMVAKDLEPHAKAPIPAEEDGLEDSDAADTDPALAWAEKEWLKVVQEPRGENWDLIDSYIRGPKGLVWKWEDRYDQNGEFAWCGAFVARALGEIGLRKSIRLKSMASTVRIVNWARGTDRYLDDPRDVEPGDIVIVGDKRKKAGNHITLAIRRDGDNVLTYEGNARGKGPNGGRYEGVIRHNRPFESKGLSKRKYRVMHVVRVKQGDVDGD